MKSRYKNAFLVFGLVVLAVMVSQLDFAEVWRGLQRAGYWFPVILVLWALLYLLNTASWLTIIRSQQGDSRNVKFAWLYKLTVSGFALNYATPGGLMGGEPYRIMELAPRIGTERASSSVILYAMTHIFSHLCFWLLSVVLFVALYPVDLPMAIMLAGFVALIYGIRSLVQKDSSGLYFLLLGLAAIFLFSGLHVFPCVTYRCSSRG